MVSLSVEAADKREESAVLSKAVLRASQRLGLTQKDQARILGLSAASLSRLARGAREVDVDGKEGELALLLVRLYRSLDALIGGDEAKSREWLHAENQHLDGKPSELIRSIQGLVHVVEYLDAMRGRL
ncbi:MAG: MbcA/ParS/Xre antitoxin family protein [Acidobacteriota bacterium]|nr:MAG: MbcA/ParS/Xre antitoxin family protein [Acidobacteriota bacterium]